MLAAPPTPRPVSADPAVSTYQNDPRLTRLQRYFAARGYPLKDEAEAFLKAADENALDWRLLPSISIVESSGGKAARNNNVLGWGSASAKFASARESIHAVARRLSTSKLYKNKDVDGVLRTYNTNAEYPLKVKKIMNAISPATPRVALAMD